MDNSLFPGLETESKTTEKPWSEAEAAFEKARRYYPKRTGKAGHDKEWADFRKHVKDWKKAAFELYPAIRIIELYHLKIEPKETRYWLDFGRFCKHRKWEQALELAPILKAKGLL